jgi:hypothetical protein
VPARPQSFRPDLAKPVARLRGAGVDVRGALTRQDPGSGPWHLDDRELLQAVKTHCSLDELALAIRDLISGDDFHLVEPNLAGFPPGEYVEEAVERSAVFGAQAIEDPNGPLRGSGLGDSRYSGSRGLGPRPLGQQPGGPERVHPDAVPATASQMM